MTASNLLAGSGLNALAEFIKPYTLLAFDLDGTLAPIVENHTAAKVAEPVRAVMKRLCALTSVAVITGRARKDAQSILGFNPQLLIGNYGAEWSDESAPRNLSFVFCCMGWLEKLNEFLGNIRGLEIEFKGESISIHYRRTEDRENALALIQRTIGGLDPKPNVIGGKCVINLLPEEALTKGEALVAAMLRTGSKRAVYFGDDQTDETVFRMGREDIFGVHIGKDDRTAARYYLESQEDILELLACMIGFIETCHR